MKLGLRHSPSLAALCLLLVPASADTIYSGLLDTVISTDFDGVTVNIEGGTLNPFFGGVGVANNAALQPLRDGTGDLDTLLNLAAGTTIDGSSLFYSTGAGGSQDHLGSTFTAGQEGYIGFQLNGADYGWMRVVFTNNTGGALIKDWAYDNSGGSIATGNVLQSGSTVTLDSSFGSFTLASSVTGSNSVVKTGTGTATLNAANSYSGTTTVNQGTLLINGDQSAATGEFIVNAGATLGGTGTLGGSVTLDTLGTLSTASSIGSMATGDNTWNGGSSVIFEFSTDGASGVAGSQWDQLTITGSLVLSGASSSNPITLGLFSMADAANSGLLASWNPDADALWSGFVTTTDGVTDFAADMFSFDTSGFQNTLNGNFSVLLNGNNLDLAYTAIPETSTALLGGLGLLVLLRRRRN